MRNSLLALTLSMAIVACKNNTTTPATSSSTNTAVTASGPSLTPEQLGEIGASIKKHPSDGTKILSDHGMTQEQFERAIRQVSSDPAASKRYAAAYKRNV
jgi:ABC-type enterochelin transport system substrate-binding protein